MDPAIVPGILLTILLIFSTNGKPNSTASANVPAPEPMVSFEDHPSLEVENADMSGNSDYQIIYSFITKKYTRVPTSDADQIARNLVQFGQEKQIDPKFGAAIMARESAFDRLAVSSTGAKGLGQIKDFNFKSLNIDDPYDIQQNTRGTLAYMKYLLGLWKTESKRASLALASYFKGYSAVNKTGKLVDSTTKNYVKDIIVTYDRLNQMKSISQINSNSSTSNSKLL
ncbi:hypothetical protein EB093_04355 [bacterium]|nr:hypothetical protein [bacterium]